MGGKGVFFEEHQTLVALKKRIIYQSVVVALWKLRLPVNAQLKYPKKLPRCSSAQPSTLEQKGRNVCIQFLPVVPTDIP